MRRLWLAVGAVPTVGKPAAAGASVEACRMRGCSPSGAAPVALAPNACPSGSGLVSGGDIEGMPAAGAGGRRGAPSSAKDLIIAIRSHGHLAPGRTAAPPGGRRVLGIGRADRRHDVGRRRVHPRRIARGRRRPSPRSPRTRPKNHPEEGVPRVLRRHRARDLCQWALPLGWEFLPAAAE